MNLRRISAALALASAATAVLVATAQPAMATVLFTEFTGGGFARTADGAIAAAIDDATNSAAASQLYHCALLGTPSVFGPTVHPYRGLIFHAEATVTCTP